MKDDYCPAIIVSDQDQVNIYLQKWSPPGFSNLNGSSTIKGNIIGMPDYVPYAYAYIYSRESNKYSVGSVNMSAKSYIISNCPDNGEIYLYTNYSTLESGVLAYNIAYNKLNMSPGTVEVNLEFANNALDCNVAVPIGYETRYAGMYLSKCAGAPGASIGRYLNGKYSFIIDKIPGLQVGDSFVLAIQIQETTGTNKANLYKYSYNVSGAIYVDMSSMHKVGLIDPTPPEGSIIITKPTIAWQPVSAANVGYTINIYDNQSGRRLFDAYTKSNRITIPGLFNYYSGRTYRIYITAIVAQDYIIEDIFSMYNNVDQVIASEVRDVMGGYNGASSIDVEVEKYGNLKSKSIVEDMLGIRLYE